MAGVTTIYPKSVTWNGITFDKTKGLQRVDFQHTSQPVEDRGGGQEYPVNVFLVNKGLTLSITVREFCQDQGANMDCGTTSNAVVTLDTCEGTDTCTFAGMMLVDISGSQDHGVPSEATLTFVHQSTDGSADPVS